MGIRCVAGALKARVVLEAASVGGLFHLKRQLPAFDDGREATRPTHARRVPPIRAASIGAALLPAVASHFPTRIIRVDDARCGAARRRHLALCQRGDFFLKSTGNLNYQKKKNDPERREKLVKILLFAFVWLASMSFSISPTYSLSPVCKLADELLSALAIAAISWVVVCWLKEKKKAE